MRKGPALIALAAGIALAAASPPPAVAQELPVPDSVLRTIWEEGMERSQAYRLGQVLLDSLGPRLTGSPGSEAAARWVLDMYDGWGIEGRLEEYGSWRGWRRGVTHVDLVEPRLRSLEGTMLAWSPGSDGPVTGPVVAPPTDPARMEEFLADVEGKLVLLSNAEITCRPDENWEEFATGESLDSLREAREAADEAWERRIGGGGGNAAGLARMVEEAGAAGVLSSRWSRGWGVQKIFSAWTTSVPHLDLSCEDYGLVFRLAENDQSPVVRIVAEAEDLGEVPVANVIGVIPGTGLPDEYVVLSAHFDSWDGASGATDNGTGTVTMMEAARILTEALPRPKRTILIGLWNGEEQGLNGSRAFAADHPEVVEGLQALFNQDNGTGRVARISTQGLTDAGAYFARWLSRIPESITQHIDLIVPGRPGGGGSDYASFVCAGAPAFSLSSLSWDYGTYTWHTNRDTFDKVVIDDVKNNATLTAMLAYLASEEPDRLPRTRRVLPPDPRTGEPGSWPACRDGARSSR